MSCPTRRVGGMKTTRRDQGDVILTRGAEEEKPIALRGVSGDGGGEPQSTETCTPKRRGEESMPGSTQCY